MSKLKSCFKTSQGIFEIGIEGKKEEKPELLPKTTFYLYKRGIDLLQIKNEKLKGMFLSCSNSKKVFIYDLSFNQTLPFLSLDCTNFIVTSHKLRQKGIESRAEILIGFETGEVITYSFAYTSGSHSESKKESFNLEKVHDNTPVSCLTWRDGDTFLVAHESGNIYLYHREYKGCPIPSKDQLESYYVIHNEKPSSNPMTKISLMKERIYEMKYSPNGKYIGAVTAKGHLYILNSDDYTIVIVFKSYFGGLLCLDWSQDSKYIVTGGEDDSILIICPFEECIIARGISGHKANVSSVLFDTVQTSDDFYRILSTGQDGILSVWEIDKPSEFEKTPSTKILDVTFIQCTSKIPTFEPISSQKIHSQPIGEIIPFNDGFITFCFDNTHKIWLKPNHEFKIIPKVEKIVEKK